MGNKQEVCVTIDGYAMNEWLDEMLDDRGVSTELWGLVADEVLGTMDKDGCRDMSGFEEHIYLLGQLEDVYDILRVAAKDYMRGRLDSALEKDYPKVFKYMGYEFVPVRQLTGDEEKMVMRSISTDGVFLSKSERNWDYGEFYAAAGNDDCDLFRMVGRDELWIPGSTMLFKYEA